MTTASAHLLVSALPRSSGDPDAPPYVYTRQESMGTAAFDVQPSRALLAAIDATPFTHFRAVDAATLVPRYEWRFNAFESIDRLGGEIDTTPPPLTRGDARKPPSWTRSASAANNYSLRVPESSAFVRRQDAGVYRLVRCAHNAHDSAPEQLVIALVLYVTHTFDTLVLAPNTPSVTVSASVPDVELASAADADTHWLVLALDKRVQQMRRPALQRFNDDLRHVGAFLSAAAKRRGDFTWGINAATGATEVLSDTLIEHVNDAQLVRDAWLWTEDPSLHAILLLLVAPSSVAAADASLDVLCRYPFPHTTKLYYGKLLVPVPRDSASSSSSKDVFVAPPRYITWTQVLDRIVTAYPQAAHHRYTVLRFVDLLIKYTTRLYDGDEPLYGMADSAEFMYMPPASNPRGAYDHCFELQLPVDDDRVLEEYARPHGLVAAPMNYLCVALRSGSAHFTLSSARVVGVTHVHVLPDCVVRGTRAPAILSDGVVPPVYDNTARQALALRDSNWFRSESDAVRSLWYAVRTPANCTSQRDILSAVARMLSAQARQYGGNMFGVARSLGDNPEVNTDVDDDPGRHGAGTVFVCVEETNDRLTLAQSLLLCELRASAEANTDTPTTIDFGTVAAFEQRPAPIASPGTLKTAARFCQFALRRVRCVLHYAPAIEPPVEVAAPLALSFESALLNSYWDARLSHVRNAITQALARQRAKDVLVLVSAESKRPVALEDDSLSALDVLAARKRYVSATNRAVVVDPYATVRTIHYTGNAAVSLTGMTIARLLSLLTDAIDESVLGEYARVDDIPVLELCARYGKRQARNGFTDPLQERFASATIDALSQRFSVLWQWIVRTGAYDGANFARDPAQVRLADIDTTLLLQRYGSRMEPEHRQLIRDWHTPSVTSHVLAELLHFERAAVDAAVAPAITAAVLAGVLAIVAQANPRSVGMLPPALVRTNAAAPPAPPPQPGVIADIDAQAAANLADLLEAFGVLLM